MTARSPAAAAEGRDTRVAVLLAVAAIVAAALAARATLLSGAAGDEWQRAVRGEAKQSAMIVNHTIYAYNEVPFALGATEHRYVALELGKSIEANPQLSRPLFETFAVEAYASKLSKNEKPWVRGDGSFAVHERIASLVKADSTGTPPEEVVRGGDAQAHRAWVIGLAILPAAAGFFFAALAQALPRARRVAVPLAVLLVVAALLAAAVAEMAT